MSLGSRDFGFIELEARGIDRPVDQIVQVGSNLSRQREGEKWERQDVFIVLTYLQSWS